MDEKSVKDPIQIEIVTNKTANDGWDNVWAFMEDPDTVLANVSQTSEVFENLLSDCHVFSCYQSRKSGVTNAEWRIEYPDGAEKQSEFYEGLLERIDFEKLINQILDAPFYGFSVCEVIWGQSDGRWVPERIEQKPNHWFVFDQQRRLRFLHKDHQFDGLLLPDYKFLLAQHHPTFENPYGRRVLSRCFWPVVFKKAGYKYWSQFLEKYGIPWAVGRVPRGTKLEDRERFLDALGNMVQAAVAVINDDEKIELMTASGTGAARGGMGIPFQSMIDSANAEISKVMLGQTLSTEIGSKGAYAASQSHLSVRSDICTADKKLAARKVNELFSWLQMFNFGKGAAPILRFIEEEDDKEAHSRRDANLVNQGVRFKPEYYMRQYNLRRDEFEVKDLDEVAQQQFDRQMQLKEKDSENMDRQRQKSSDENRQKGERKSDRKKLPSGKEKE